MTPEWFYSRDEETYGPISTAALKKLPGKGLLRPDDHVWKEGMKEWVEARRLKGLFPDPPVEEPVSPEVLPGDEEGEPTGREEPTDVDLGPASPLDSVSYVTRDPHWFKKMALGGLVMAVPILDVIGDGYQIQTIKNIRAGHEHPLPEWRDLGKLFVQGLPLRVIIYGMYLPTLAVTALAIFMDIVGLFGWILSPSSGSKMDLEDMASQWVIGTVGQWLLIAVLNLLAMVMEAALFFSVPALARRAADGATFVELLNPLPGLRLIFANFGTYVLTRLAVYVLLLVFGLIVSAISSIGLIVAIGPIIGWIILGTGRLWGRLTWAYSLAHMKMPKASTD